MEQDTQDITQEDYDNLWDDKLSADKANAELRRDNVELHHRIIELESELADIRICVKDAFSCLEMVNNLAIKCLDHPNAKGFKQWAKGFFQGLERVSKTLTQALEIED